MDSEQGQRSRRALTLRITAAVAAALAFCLGVYAILEGSGSGSGSGLISFTFLLLLPAVVCAFVAYVADPWGEKGLGSYLKVPVWILLAVIGASILALQEGVICIVMLAPLWLGSGAAGALATYKLRRRLRDGRTYCMALLAAPLVMMQVEPLLPLPQGERTVARAVVIDASPEQIWPLLRGITDVRADEGRWNVSQDVVGVPRPRGARLVGEGLGAQRLASWDREISFLEVITEWEANRRIGWHFVFDDAEGWQFTDRHLMPESPYFRIVSGGYSLQPLAPGRTKVTLETRYWMRTPVNAYSALWGEAFLGDIQNNLLAIIEQRAERNTR
jgi:hypothetical protein